MELINRIRKSRKGFTLVEIIVVLVILAILAAFTIPTMLGFVDDAKGKAMIAEAREVYVAAQATTTEKLAQAASNETGLTGTITEAALGSAAVEAAVAPTNTSTVAALASYQMQTYLKDDMDITDATAPTKDGKSYWTVTLGKKAAVTTGTTSPETFTGKIASITYSKNGYTVTIIQPATGSTSNATTTVTKY